MINTILGALLGAIFGLFASVFFSERYKTLNRRRLLVGHLRVELENLYEMNYKKYRHDQVFATPVNTNLIRSVLETEILDPRKDSRLIFELHELVSMIEKFNNFANLLNQASISKSDSTEDLFGHVIMTYEDLYSQAQEVLKIINSYKFYKSTFLNREFFQFKF